MSWRGHFSGAALLVSSILFSPARADELDVTIPLVTIHPPFAEDYSCTEHWVGLLGRMGDAIGADCYVIKVVTDDEGRTFTRAFRGSGAENEDWYSWEVPVLAPVSGKVVRVVNQAI